MAGRHAKILTVAQMRSALHRTRKRRYALRDKTMLLLSLKAGLRAGEIAKLTWSMVTGPDGKLLAHIELTNAAAKMRSGRTIPIHPDLANHLNRLRKARPDDVFVITSERGEGLRPTSVVNWFREYYRALGFAGCSSHSGRRTFITQCARLVFRAGGSLRDVQQLAGHTSLAHTQRYIDGHDAVKRRLVTLL